MKKWFRPFWAYSVFFFWGGLIENNWNNWHRLRNGKNMESIRMLPSLLRPFFLLWLEFSSCKKNAKKCRLLDSFYQLKKYKKIFEKELEGS